MRVMLVATLVLASASPCYGWGAKGHELITEGAVELADSPAKGFLRRNLRALKRLSNVPDNAWRTGATRAAESPTHFFHWDHYGDGLAAGAFGAMTLERAVARFGEKVVEDNGSAVWRLSGLYGHLVKALRDADWVRTLQVAGTLSHYAGDLAQPMHATSDYDGQSIGRRGIHAYFETTLVNKLTPADLLQRILRAGPGARRALDADHARANPTSSLVRLVGAEHAERAIAAMPEILEAFQAEQDDDALKAFFEPRMGDGAAVLSFLWDRAVAAAGVDAAAFPGGELSVPTPAFIPPGDAP